MPRIVFGYANAKEAGSLIVLYDDDGRKRAEVSIANGGESVLALFDEPGQKRVAASTRNATAGLYLLDTKDQVRLGFGIDGTAITNPRRKTSK